MTAEEIRALAEALKAANDSCSAITGPAIFTMVLAAVTAVAVIVQAGMAYATYKLAKVQKATTDAIFKSNADAAAERIQGYLRKIEDILQNVVNEVDYRSLMGTGSEWTYITTQVRVLDELVIDLSRQNLTEESVQKFLRYRAVVTECNQLIKAGANVTRANVIARKLHDAAQKP